MTTETQAPDPAQAAQFADGDSPCVLEWGAVSLPFGDPSRVTNLMLCATLWDAIAEGALCGFDWRVYPLANVVNCMAQAAIPAPEGAQLPPLPHPLLIAGGGQSWFNAEQMRAYARAALAAPAPQDSLDSAQSSKGVAMQAPQAPAWQPIETAPKERGGLVDIICNERRYTGCHYDRICDEYRHITACGVLIRLKGATHWMPIPAAPQTKEPTNDR